MVTTGSRDVLVWTKAPLLFRNELDASVFSSLVSLAEPGLETVPSRRAVG